MSNLRQLYDEQGRPLPGQGATKDDILTKALLHGVAHVWIWRCSPEGQIEVLVQKRSATKRTSPGKYDVSAAGHIDLDETPLAAALRETHEEVGLEIPESGLKCFGVHRALLTLGDDIENEFQWLYILELDTNQELTANEEEVSVLSWQPFSIFREAVLDPVSSGTYFAHGDTYFNLIISTIEAEALSKQPA
jgi:8-oxo-dGTP pyrophosphatase MutT (NUDIX family)